MNKTVTCALVCALGWGGCVFGQGTDLAVSELRVEGDPGGVELAEVEWARAGGEAFRGQIDLWARSADGLQELSLHIDPHSEGSPSPGRVYERDESDDFCPSLWGGVRAGGQLHGVRSGTVRVERGADPEGRRLEFDLVVGTFDTYAVSGSLEIAPSHGANAD